MAKTTMRIEGLKELEAALMELPKTTGKNVLRRALINAATPMAEAAKRFAPARPDERLRKSIKVGKVKFSSGNAGKRAFAEAMARGATRAEAGAAAHEANIGSNEDVTSALVVMGPGVFYAHFQEFGTVHNRPHAFMRPAWDQGKTNAAETIKNELKSEIDKAVARIARKALRAAAK